MSVCVQHRVHFQWGRLYPLSIGYSHGGWCLCAVPCWFVFWASRFSLLFLCLWILLSSGCFGVCSLCQPGTIYSICRSRDERQLPILLPCRCLRLQSHFVCRVYQWDVFRHGLDDVFQLRLWDLVGRWGVCVCGVYVDDHRGGCWRRSWFAGVCVYLQGRLGGAECDVFVSL